MMTYDFTKFERGQVWMIRFKNPNECIGHEQQKDRPWLILSVGKFNKSSGMVTAAPITTRDNIRTPSQVLFNNDRGIRNVILCENIRTFDYTSGAYIFDFMGNISTEVLEKVDVALSVHLGMHYSPITLNKLYESMEAIIKSVGYMQEKANTPKFTDDDVLKFAEKLQSLASLPASDEVCATKIEDFDKNFDTVRVEDNLSEVVSPSDKHVSLMKPYYVNPQDPPEPTSTNKPEKSTRIKWTPETCRKFIDDANKLPMKRVMELWNISKKIRFYSTKNYAQSLLDKGTN